MKSTTSTLMSGAYSIYFRTNAYITHATELYALCWAVMITGSAMLVQPMPPMMEMKRLLNWEEGHNVAESPLFEPTLSIL